MMLCWFLAALISFFCIGIIGYKWLQVQRIRSVEVNTVKNASEVADLFKFKNTVEFENGEKPYQVPTGFFIQSLKFMSLSDVNITGYIWQKYPEDFPEDIERGFIFPEEVNSGNTKLIEMYSHSGIEEGIRYDMTGWYFDVTVRQAFDYSKYPLDFLTVWIRLWPREFANDSRLIMVPDFQSYHNTEKKSFGLDSDIVQGEWEIDETFFSYNDMAYDTNFGFFTDAQPHLYKEFFINLGLKRKFINAFIVNLVPLFLVCILLFATMMTVTGEKELVKKFGFDTGAAVSTCAALFFVVLIAHTHIREKLSGCGLVYIEYFYLIMYAVILITALNAYLFSLGKQKYVNFIYYGDNFIPKVIYWPVVLMMMATVTWCFL